MLVLRYHDQRVGLVVDRLFGENQTVIKPLSRTATAGVPGSAILGNGRVALILEVEGLLREALRGSGASPRRREGMFRNWTIGKKLTGAFSLMSILVAIVGVIGALDLARVRREADVITSSARGGRRSRRFRWTALKQTAAEKDYLLSGDQKMRELHRPSDSVWHARCRDRQGAAVRRRQTRRGARAGQSQEPGLRPTFEEAVALPKRTIEAINLSMNEWKSAPIRWSAVSAS